MRDILAKRAEATSEEDSYEAKHARAMEKINNAMGGRISLLRVVGPAKPQMADKHARFLTNRTGTDMTIGLCRFCNPDPQTFKCRLCDWETEDRWRMWIHNVVSPQWCRDWADKKARHWSRKT